MRLLPKLDVSESFGLWRVVNDILLMIIIYVFKCCGLRAYLLGRTTRTQAYAVGWGNFDRPQGEPPGPTERRRRRKRERGEEEEEGEEEIM